MPNSKTKLDKIIWRLNCTSQYIKNNPLRIKNRGKMRVNTDKRGKNLGARNGKK